MCGIIGCVGARDTVPDLIEGLRRLANKRAIVYDIKGMFHKDEVDGRL